ncbi:MAG: hypothetical protein ACXABY_24735 [Candidatus Thorarchaeota archaeon]|jgi:hypothetical protein
MTKISKEEWLVWERNICLQSRAMVELINKVTKQFTYIVVDKQGTALDCFVKVLEDNSYIVSRG